MIVKWAVLDASGTYPTTVGASPKLPDTAIEVPSDMQPMDLINMMLVAGQWTTRPMLVDPSVTEGVGWTSLAFPMLPTGTICTVQDAETGDLLDTVSEENGWITITLPDAGPYHVEVSPPLPYLPYRTKVSVQ